jgi:DNA-binding MltR family transcriptional regulator
MRSCPGPDSGSVDELMKDGQALQSFNSKLKLAYALGLLPEDVRADLHCLNKIRNYFAHEVGVTSFDKAPIRDLCGNLSTVKARDGKARTPREDATMRGIIWLDSVRGD